MTGLAQVAIGFEAALFTLNLAVAVSLVCCVGLAAARICRRCSAPSQHGMLLATLTLALTAPVLVRLGQQVGPGWIHLSLPPPRNADQPASAEPARGTHSVGPRVEPSAGPPPHYRSEERPADAAVATRPAGHPPGGQIVVPDATPPERMAPEPPHPPQGRPAWSWPLAASLLAAVWLAGSLAGAWRLWLGWLSVARLRRSSQPIFDSRLERLAQQAARAVGWRRAPPLVTSRLAPVPLSLGLLRPVIVLPEGILREMGDEPLEAILVHEMAHIARRDHWVGLAQRVAAVLYWWNPAVHCVGRRLSDLSEQICDDYVVCLQGGGQGFARLLVEMAARSTTGVYLPATTGVLQSKLSGLHGRIARLLDEETNRMTRMKLGTAVAVVALAGVLACVLLTSGIRAEEESQPAPAPVADAPPPKIPVAEEDLGGSGVPQGPVGRVTLRHERDEYFVGEPIVIDYCLTNVGTEPLPIEFGGDYRGTGRHERFKITVVDAQGKEVPDVLMQVMEMGGLMQVGQKLKPGEEHVESLELHKYRRLVDPGQYTIRVEHDLGWDPKVTRPPVGETTITLTLPNPEEARAVIAKSPDLSILRHPVYLPILLELVRAGDHKALAGIGGIQTVDSTKALLELVDEGLREDDLDLALAAYDSMGERLPNPRFFQDNYGDYYEPNRELLKRVWRPEFAEPLRRLASRLARDPEPRAIGTISFIFECVGKAEDMPDLILGYTKSIEATKTLPFETHQYFRPRGSAYSYRFSTRELLGRGAEVPTNPQTPGAAAVYLIAMQAREDFRPADWPEQVVRWLRYETPYTREFVLDHMPEPAPAAALDMLPELLADDYVDLQIAACGMAGKHPQEAFREPIRTILRTETEQYLLNAATAAGPPNGVTTDQIMEIWLDRLDNDDLAGNAVVRLLLSVLPDNQARSPKELDAEAIKATRARWGRFIEEHREALREGRRFKLGDPEITADLFPPGFQFYYDGKPWPAS